MSHARPENQIPSSQPPRRSARSLSPGAPIEARPNAEQGIQAEHDAVPGARLEAKHALEGLRRRQLESVGMKLVEAHRVVSRECTNDDVRRIVMDAFLMVDLFGERTIALAHPQVNDKDPLRFFVLRDLLYPGAKSTIIVNPRIVRHSGYTVDSVEGCHTWPERPHTTKQRWRMCDVEYQVPDGDKLSPVITETIKALPAFVFQHELDHLGGIYCYDEATQTP